MINHFGIMKPPNNSHKVKILFSKKQILTRFNTKICAKTRKNILNGFRMKHLKATALSFKSKL